MKTFFHKLKTNFSFRKNVITTSAIIVLLALGITLITKNDGFNFLTNVLPLGSVGGVLNKCVDSDGGSDRYTKGTISGIYQTNDQVKNLSDFCSTTTMLIEYNCGKKNNVISGAYACPNGCINGACTIAGQGYGYGYGYRSTGTNNGYGYGYGYKKIDPNTNQPYIYLLDVFTKYSKNIYQAVVNKIGFQMVKSYNTKEFVRPTK